MEICFPGGSAVVQLLSRAWLFATPWTATRQASLSFTIFWSLHKLMSIGSLMPSNHPWSPPISPALKDKLKDFLNQVGTIYLYSVFKEQCSLGLWVMTGGCVWQGRWVNASRWKHRPGKGTAQVKLYEQRQWYKGWSGWRIHQKEWLEIRGSWWYHPGIFPI